VTGALPSIPRVCVALGLGRTHERRLVAACLADRRLRTAARCTSAPELLATFEAGDADVALVDEHLHLLTPDELGPAPTRPLPGRCAGRRPGGRPVARVWRRWWSSRERPMPARSSTPLNAPAAVSFRG
jgi:hypothetical protein